MYIYVYIYVYIHICIYIYIQIYIQHIPLNTQNIENSAQWWIDPILNQDDDSGLFKIKGMGHKPKNW